MENVTTLRKFFNAIITSVRVKTNIASDHSLVDHIIVISNHFYFLEFSWDQSDLHKKDSIFMQKLYTRLYILDFFLNVSYCVFKDLVILQFIVLIKSS